MQTFNFIQIQNNKVQVDELKSMVMKDANNYDKSVKHINGVASECKSIAHRDRCEFAFQLRSCIDKTAILHALN